MQDRMSEHRQYNSSRPTFLDLWPIVGNAFDVSPGHGRQSIGSAKCRLAGASWNPRPASFELWSSVASGHASQLLRRLSINGHKRLSSFTHQSHQVMNRGTKAAITIVTAVYIDIASSNVRELPAMLCHQRNGQVLNISI